MAITLTKQTKKNTNSKDGVEVLKKLKDTKINIDLKQLEWSPTSKYDQYGSYHFHSKFIVEDKLQVRIQVFIRPL